MAGGYVKLVSTGRSDLKAKSGYKIHRPKRVFKAKRYNKLRGPSKDFSYGKGIRSLIPRQKWMNVVYKSGAILTKAAGNYSQGHLYLTNSLYDPDNSNYTKNQKCMGMDLLTTLYNKYRVYSCRVKVTATNPNAIPVRMVMYNYNGTTPSTSTLPSNMASRDQAKSVVISPYTTDGDTKTLTFYVNVYKAVGVNKYVFMGDNYQAAMNSSPTTTSKLLLSFGHADDIADDTLTLKYDIEINYWAVLFDPVDNTDSA